MYAELWERIKDEGEQVWTVEWESGGCGIGGGVEAAYLFHGRYYVVHSEDELTDEPGPEPVETFATLKEAVEAGGLNYVTTATLSITTNLPAAEAAAMLEVLEEEVEGVMINGSVWVYEGGRFRLDTES
jgi:hypothetical protein